MGCLEGRKATSVNAKDTKRNKLVVTIRIYRYRLQTLLIQSIDFDTQIDPNLFWYQKPPLLLTRAYLNQHRLTYWSMYQMLEARSIIDYRLCYSITIYSSLLT